ncbi:MAG: adenylyl-sulfate kinase [Chitinophagales bacterium]
MKDIFPTCDKLLSRKVKETLLNQQGKVFWLFGQSGSGKTTIAIELEKQLHAQGKYTVVLDGDNLRSGLNAGLGFTTEDRMENIRRAAELAKILVQNGAIVICCFVCPLKSMRDLARDIIGDDFFEIYIKTSLETLIQKDTKGFYKKAQEGKMENLTGINSDFEEGVNSDIIIDTDKVKVEEAVQVILNYEF